MKLLLSRATGIEKQVCENSRTMITAEGDGVVDYVDATRICILYDRTEDEDFVSFDSALKRIDSSEVPPHQSKYDN